MIFAQSSFNYQTRSSNHEHPVQPASCIPFAVRSSAVRTPSEPGYISVIQPLPHQPGNALSRITDTEPAMYGLVSGPIYGRNRHVIDDNS